MKKKLRWQGEKKNRRLLGTGSRNYGINDPLHILVRWVHFDSSTNILFFKGSRQHHLGHLFRSSLPGPRKTPTRQRKTPKGKNVIALALHQAANSIENQKEHPLTPFFKRIAYRKGRNAAITATARRPAVIIWNMITKPQSYFQPNTDLLIEKRKNAQVKNIKMRLFRLNLTDSEIATLFEKTSFPST